MDGSNGLAHLYESDKVQPGRPWHARAVRFTERICHEFGRITRQQLKAQIDGLFQECLRRMLRGEQETAEEQEISLALAAEPDTSMPPDVVAEAQKVTGPETEAYVPDADLATEFAEILSRQEHNLTETQVSELSNELLARARYYFKVGQKRQNVLGAGFEDVLGLLIKKLTTVPTASAFFNKKADLLPGFGRRTKRERIEAPDLAIVVRGETKLLASFKWSLRHDRLKQLTDELDCYVDLCQQRTFPRYVLVTNEYDPGRLIIANQQERKKRRLDCIYHLRPELLREVLNDNKDFTTNMDVLVQEGRLKSVADFLMDLNRQYGAGGTVQPLTPDQKRQLAARQKRKH